MKSNVQSMFNLNKQVHIIFSRFKLFHSQRTRDGLCKILFIYEKETKRRCRYDETNHICIRLGVARIHNSGNNYTNCDKTSSFDASL